MRKLLLLVIIVFLWGCTGEKVLHVRSEKPTYGKVKIPKGEVLYQFSYYDSSIVTEDTTNNILKVYKFKYEDFNSNTYLILLYTIE